MNRLFVSITTIVTLMFSVMVSYAFDTDAENPHHLADYMLDTTQLYVGTQIGADYFNELDRIAVSVYDKLPENLDIDRMTIDGFFRSEFENLGYDYDAFLTLLGDYAAIGIEPRDDVLGTNDDPYTTIVAEITDRDAFIDAVVTLATPFDEVPPNLTGGDDFLVFEDLDVVIYATDTHFIVSTNPAYEFPLESSLSADADFTDTVNMLPADTYSSVIYVSEEFEFDDDGGEFREFLDENGVEASSFVLGTTAFDDALAVDIAGQALAFQTNTVDTSTMLTLLPADADAFIAGDNLTDLYDTIITFTEDQEFAEQLPFFFGMTGLDLEDDVLSWTTGTYAIFMSTDSASILDQVEATEMITDLPLDFGIVIEATDADLARNTADKLGEFMDVMLAGESAFTISRVDESDASFPLTTVVLNLPNDDLLDVESIEFVITANDNLFYMGTTEAYNSLSAGQTLANDSVITGATAYLLDNPTSVWYLNGDGVVLPIFSTLGVTIRSDDDMSAFLQTPEDAFAFLRSIDDIIDYQTITTSLDDNGVVRLRATLTLNP